MSEFDELDGYPQRIQPNQLFEKLIKNPREAFVFIEHYQYGKHVTLFLFTAGIVRSFDRAISSDLGDRSSLLEIIGFSVILGGLFGWISYYIYAALISWMGKWLHGSADTKSVLRVLAYALFPSVFSLILIGIQIALFGIEIFKANYDVSETSFVIQIAYYGLALLTVLFGIWSFILCVIAVSVIQQFSIGKAILNLLLPAMVLVGIILFFILVF